MDPFLFLLLKLLNYVDYFVDFTGGDIEEDLLWGVAGRAFFIICYLTYLFHLPSSVLTKDALAGNLKSKEAWFKLIKFILKNLVIIGCAIFLPVFMFSYSIVLGGFLLLISVEHERNLLKRGLLRFFGGLFGIIVPIVGPITLWILFIMEYPNLSFDGFLILFFTAEGLIIESISATAAVALVLPRYWTYYHIKGRSEYWEHVKRNLWHRAPVYAKVGLITGMVIVSWIGFTAWYLPNQQYFSWTEYVAMEDGTLLKTAVYVPKDWEGEAHSVVLLRTPYDIDTEAYIGYVNLYVVNQGRILVMQDTRGNHGSQGDFPIFRSEYVDGPKTIEWIMAQSWCDGHIASRGASAEAATQIYCHAEGPDGLDVAFIHSGPSDLYDQWVYPGGCLRKDFLESWLPGVDSIDEYINMVNHPTKDAFWASTSLTMNSRYQNVNCRAVHLGGWYDCFAQGTIDSFYYYNNYGDTYALDRQILVMGPYNHGRPHPDASFTNDSWGYSKAFEMETKLQQESFDGIPVDWISQPNVYYFVMGDNESIDPKVNQWRTAMNWPIPEASYEPWYLQSDFSLSNTTPSSTANHSYLFDPSDPVHNGGGTTYSLIMGAYDNHDVEDGRTDILKFTTPILTDPVEIVGRLNATLYITSNCTDTDFTVKLLDIYPDGREIIVASGILKTRYRNGFSSADVQFMEEDTVYQLNIDMWSTAIRFVPGHRIRVSVSSSNFPEFAVNDNTGGPITANLGGTYNIANNTVLCGAPGQYSCIWFPRTE